MTITKKAKWQVNDMLNGVAIYKRVAGTGTTGGGWMCYDCGQVTFGSKLACMRYIINANVRAYDGTMRKAGAQ